MNIIEKLSDPSVESKLSVIDFFIERAKKQIPSDKFCDLMFNFVLDTGRTSIYNDYNLVGPKYALGCFVANALFYYIMDEDFKLQIDILKNFSNSIGQLEISQNKVLKKTTAAKLINAVEVFGIPTPYLKADNKPLNIFHIPFNHKIYNGHYYPYLNSIASYKPHTENCSPEYIFLHEVGHLIIYKLAGNPHKVPDSFVEFTRLHNPKWNDDLVEIFVDLFSVAVMLGTEFEPLNPLIVSRNMDKIRGIKEYFVELIKVELKKGSIRI